MIFDQLSELLAGGEPAVLLTVVDKDGSTPRGVGTRMVVTANAEYGTIGGGTVEGLAIETAREVLAGTADPGVRSYELERGGNTGMVCGGSMDVFVDRLQGQARLYIAGAGHISQELAPLAERLGYDVTVVDDREEFADTGRFPDGTEVVCENYGDLLNDRPMTEATAVAVATRSSTFDQRAVGAALDGGAGYVGLVASDTKTEHTLDGLAESGYDRTDLARVRAPVGLKLGGERPADIALSILAEVQSDRYGGSGRRASLLDLDDLVVVRGGGDLGSGVVYRLHQAGFPVIVTETPEPTVVRRAVAFGSAIYEDETEIEGVVGWRAANPADALDILTENGVAVLEDPEAAIAEELGASVVVDAIMAKGRIDTGTRRNDAPTVIGLGPGFEAGTDVDAVVETDRGHELGRVIYEGTASQYDGEPGERRGYTHERVLRAPTDGRWEHTVEIGDAVAAGDVIGSVDGQPVKTEIDGLLRGLIHEGLTVTEGMKLGDVDPRETVDHTKISDKALCLGGGVLEAVCRLGL